VDEHAVNTLVAKVRADAGELGVFRHRLRAWLAASGLRDGLQGETVLAVHETLAATIEHVRPEEPIAVRGSVEGGAVTVEVTNGPWHPEHVDESRRLNLLQQLVDEVEIRPTPGGTIIRLRQSLDS
jgi:anti-sigma regulatory factor (Ser/Thr protein kinase)